MLGKDLKTLLLLLIVCFVCNLGMTISVSNNLESLKSIKSECKN